MKCRILAVEDSATQAEALRALLEGNGYEVDVARSGEAALERLASAEFDLVLSDVTMPGMTGYELCHRIRKDPGRRKLPVVLLTSRNDPMDIVRGLECGADNYITKPYDPDQLLARLRHVLDNRRLRQDAKTSLGVTVRFMGKDLAIGSDREQILDLFISSVEEVVQANEALQRSQRELAEAHEKLEVYAREREREARISTDRYRALLQNAGSAIFVLDLDGSILELNPQATALLGRPAEDVLQRSLLDLVSPNERDELSVALSSLSDGAPTWHQERRFLTPGGGEIWCELSASRTESDGTTLILLIVQDITERKEAEKARLEREEAERANRAKSEFLSRMSHELRSPLNGILGFGQLLLMDGLTSDQKEAVDQILRGGRHLLQLINEVLDLARIEAGGLSLSLEPVSAEDVIREVVDLMVPVAQQRGIMLTIETHEAPDVYVLADVQRLKQVIINFLSNAIKFNRPQGSVTVRLAPGDEERVRIAVLDTGHGLAPQQLQKLFAPFQRLGADAEAIEGTGLGLMIAKGLAEAMGGDVGAQSEVGQGSVFWLDLRHADTPDHPATRAEFVAQGQPPEPEFSGTPTILYVEDNPSNLRLVERVLERPGFRLLTAMQASIGLELAQEHRPDLILLDRNLPDLTGEQVLERIRSDSALRNTPVIVLSADAMPGQAERIIEAGAHDYITKPIDVPRFLERVYRILEEVQQ